MKDQLQSLGIGATEVVGGHAVTRWAYDSYEVAAWGKSTMSADEAVRTIIALNTDEYGSRLYPVTRGDGRRVWVTVPD